MKKVRFDTSGAIALQLKLGRELTPDQKKPIKIDGWLVGQHVCVRKPKTDSQGWVLSLYPWGDRLTGGFFAKDDAVACAKEIESLAIPWGHVRELDITSEEYRGYIEPVLRIRAAYEADGLIMSL